MSIHVHMYVYVYIHEHIHMSDFQKGSRLKKKKASGTEWARNGHNTSMYAYIRIYTCIYMNIHIDMHI